MNEIKGRLVAESRIKGTLQPSTTLKGSLTIPNAILPPAYSGEYEITPTEETQVLETKEKYLTDNITVNPIPSNYGLITWNGATLTVS